MIAALCYLQFHSCKNHLVTRVRRLRQPKYLAGAVVGALYFWFYFFRHFFKASSPDLSKAAAALPPGLSATFESVAALVLLVIVALAWVVPHGRVALGFSEAEIAFLFPAPVRRSTLIHYKLLKSQLAILLTAFFLMLISGRFTQGGHAWMHAIGWWLLLSTLNLHFLGSSFALARLFERGVANWQRRLGVLLAALALAGVVAAWSWRSLPAPTVEDFRGLEAMAGYAQRLALTEPLPWLLLPFRWLTRPYLANDAAQFLRALWPVLGLLALQYAWVVRANISFEEATIEQARKRAELTAAVREGRWQAAAKKRKRAPFTLHPTGPRAVALLWKNLISAGQRFTLRLWLLLAVFVTITAGVLGVSGVGGETLPMVGMFAGVAILWVLLLGPQLLRQDFRQDLAVADMLKLYPMRGWQVALGELLAPTVLITAVQWPLLLLGMACLSRNPDDSTVIPVAARLAIGCGAAVILPTLNAVSLLISNAAVLLWPAWFTGGRENPQGLEATGQRLIAVLGQLLALLLALLPAAAVFTVVFFAVKFLLGWMAAVPVAAIAATAVLAAEAGAGIWLLGKLFERLDVSAETMK